MKKTKMTAQMTEKTTDATNEAGAMSQPTLTNEQVEALSNEYVGKLNKMSEKEASHWVETGRLVDEFIRKAAPDGKPKKDLYKELAKHRDAAFKAQQLRNHHQSFRLFIELGGKEGAPDLPSTFYISVLPQRLTITKKLELLKRAQAENMSVSDLKAVVAESAPKKAVKVDPELTTVEHEVVCLRTRAKNLYNDLLQLFQRTQNTPQAAALQAELKDSLKPLLDFNDAFLSDTDAAVKSVTSMDTAA